MAGMTLDVELQHKISLQVAIYFSAVRLNACCASLVRWSTSVSTTTEVKKTPDYRHTISFLKS